MDANAVFDLKPYNDPEKTISIPIVQELARSIQAAADASVLQSYVRDPAEIGEVSSEDASSLLPVIDMSVILTEENKDGRLQEMKKLSAACEGWGFFQVINHGIPISTLEKMRATVRAFFGLSLEEKMKCRQVKDSEGYGQLFVVNDDQKLDWADMLFLEIFPEHIRQREVWPQNPSDMSEVLVSYATETQKLAASLMRLSEENLGVEPGTFTDYCDGWKGSMRLNYYPPCPNPDQVLALSPHCDASFFTVVLQDEKIAGLQIRKHDHNEWNLVQPIPDAVTVVVGDFMELITLGKFKSIEHRVVPNLDKDRISVATFYLPAAGSEIKPSTHLVDPAQPTIYRKINFNAYNDVFFSKPLRGKKGFSEYLKEG